MLEHQEWKLKNVQESLEPQNKGEASRMLKLCSDYKNLSNKEITEAWQGIRVKIAETLSKTSLSSSLARKEFAKDPKGNMMQFAANELRLVTEKKLQRERILREEKNARFEAEMEKFENEKLPPHALSRKKKTQTPRKRGKRQVGRTQC